MEVSTRAFSCAPSSSCLSPPELSPPRWLRRHILQPHQLNPVHDTVAYTPRRPPASHLFACNRTPAGQPGTSVQALTLGRSITMAIGPRCRGHAPSRRQGRQAGLCHVSGYITPGFCPPIRTLTAWRSSWPVTRPATRYLCPAAAFLRGNEQQSRVTGATC